MSFRSDGYKVGFIFVSFTFCEAELKKNNFRYTSLYAADGSTPFRLNKKYRK